MIRKSSLALLVLLVMAGLLAIPAGAGSATRTSSAQKVFKSEGCKGPVNRYDPSTWACTTITVPSEVNAGDMAKVTFAVKARHKLRYVNGCFTKIATEACAYKHKFATISRGRTIRRALELQAPEGPPGYYSLENYSRVYKTWKNEQRGIAYWLVRDAMIRVVSGS